MERTGEKVHSSLNRDFHVPFVLSFRFVCRCTLGLNRIEEGKLGAVQRFELVVPERSDGQRLQIQQLCGGRVLLWQNQMSERHRQLCLTRCEQRSRITVSKARAMFLLLRITSP